ncbi:hypothetical protein CRUP_009045 [Coryphaenoides rupestris]|nr:hypothetical protein CRUP_009045 [Coryphaenoides rupestris]
MKEEEEEERRRRRAFPWRRGAVTAHVLPAQRRSVPLGALGVWRKGGSGGREGRSSRKKKKKKKKKKKQKQEREAAGEHGGGKTRRSEPCAMMMSVDVTNRNGPTTTPPNSLNLRSSHNQLLSGDCHQTGLGHAPQVVGKKYALTSIQAAMGLGRWRPPPPSSSSSSSSPRSESPQSPTPSNPQTGQEMTVNQLRKAGQDHNRNTMMSQSQRQRIAVATTADQLKD